MEFELVDKITYKGYPLRVEYFLTEKRGKRLLEALTIMQDVGSEFMITEGEKTLLKHK
ncbi:DNA-binding HxlR family transcriptional regulator [Clostridium acetobutylicum]|nr:DNA-binding HxlR family transcriptional regulator [Clostridium acetobutylicum]